MPSPSAPTHITHIPTSLATLLGEFHSVSLLILKGCISLLCTLYFCAPGYRAASWRVTVTNLSCRTVEEENHCPCRRPGTVVAAMALPSQPTGPKVPSDTASLWLSCYASLFPKLFHLGKSLWSQIMGSFWLLTSALITMHARSLDKVIPEN